MKIGNLFVLVLAVGIVSAGDVCSSRGHSNIWKIFEKGHQLLQSAVKEVKDSFRFSCPDPVEPFLLTCTGPEVSRSGIIEKVANCGDGKNFQWPETQKVKPELNFYPREFQFQMAQVLLFGFFRFCKSSPRCYVLSRESAKNPASHLAWLPVHQAHSGNRSGSDHKRAIQLLCGGISPNGS